MTVRVTLLIALLFGLWSEATTEAQTQAQPCKSTVTGTLEVVPVQSRIYGDKRLMRVWLPTGYSSSETSKMRYPVPGAPLMTASSS
jgi:hypothetical protein